MRLLLLLIPVCVAAAAPRSAPPDPTLPASALPGSAPLNSTPPQSTSPGTASRPALAPTPTRGADPAIDRLETALLHAPDADHADAAAARLAEARSAALSPTTRLLLRRAQRELDGNHGQDAMSDASDAIALEPNQALPWRQRAAVEGALGDADAAVRDLGGALSRDPADADSWAGLAEVAEKTGRYDRAVEAWRHVLLLSPQRRDGIARLHSLQRQARGAPT